MTGPAEPEDLDLDAANLWFIRGGAGDRQVHDFLTQGFVGVGYADLGDGSGLSRAAVLRAVGGDGGAAEQAANAFLSFVHRIKPGDVVFMPDPSALGLTAGLVVGPYTYRPDVDASRCRHRRTVDWRRRIPYGDLPERLAKLPAQKGTPREVPDGRLKALAHEAFLHRIGEDPFVRPQRAPSRAPSTSTRASGPRRVLKAPTQPVATRRCRQCLMSKTLDRFDGESEFCNDCL